MVPWPAWQGESACSCCNAGLAHGGDPNFLIIHRASQFAPREMALQVAVLVCLLAAASVKELAGEAPAPLAGLGRELRDAATLGIAGCSCVNLDCRCELGGNASSEDAAVEGPKSLEQVKQLAKWWGQHMRQENRTACTCTGSACYCSQARQSEQASLGHVSCMCTGSDSDSEACRCGHATQQGADNAQRAAAEPSTSEAEKQLMGQTKQLSKRFGHHFGGYGGYHHGGYGGYGGHSCHCYSHGHYGGYGHYGGHTCHCMHHYR